MARGIPQWGIFFRLGCFCEEVVQGKGLWAVSMQHDIGHIIVCAGDLPLAGRATKSRVDGSFLERGMFFHNRCAIFRLLFAGCRVQHFPSPGSWHNAHQQCTSDVIQIANIVGGFFASLTAETDDDFRRRRSPPFLVQFQGTRKKRNPLAPCALLLQEQPCLKRRLGHRLGAAR